MKSKGKHAQGKHARKLETYPKRENDQVKEDVQVEAASVVPPLPAPPAPAAGPSAAEPSVPAAPKPPAAPSAPKAPAVTDSAEDYQPQNDDEAHVDEAAETAEAIAEESEAAEDVADDVADDDSASADVSPEEDDPEQVLFQALQAHGVDYEITSDHYPTGFLSVVPEGVTLKKKHNVGKVVGITFGIIIGALLLVYIGGAIVFMNWFFPRTIVADNDISMMSNEDVAVLLDKAVDDYTLNIVGSKGFSYQADADDVNLSIDSQATVADMHSYLNPWTWPIILIEGEHDVTSQLDLTFNKMAYDYKIVNAVKTYNQGATPPVDATIVYDEPTKRYIVQPEVQGTQYNPRLTLAAMNEAVEGLNPTVSLTDEYLVQPRVFSSDERLIESAEIATGLVSADVTLVLGGQPVSEITGAVLSSFIRMDANMGVTLDDAALNQWVTDLTNSFDTVGTQRTYTRADGKVITVSGGVYGWLTDAAATRDQVIAAVKAGQKTTVEIPCHQMGTAFNGPGQRDWGNRYIDVDISEQYVRFYGDDGSIIWETPCISGQPDGIHNTVNGVWMVNNKQSPSKLIGYENGEKQYETTVQYWMAFEANSIGFHDATWQPGFGGSMYANGYGSHGCVNLSYGAAESLYGIINVGDVVVVHF